MSGRMLYIHALSPVQNGTGRGSGVIDLPVARESTTGWPAIYASTIKGVLRDACGEHIPRRHENETDGEKRARQAAEAPHRAAFGPDVDEDPAGTPAAFSSPMRGCFASRRGRWRAASPGSPARWPCAAGNATTPWRG